MKDSIINNYRPINMFDFQQMTYDDSDDYAQAIFSWIIKNLKYFNYTEINYKKVRNINEYQDTLYNRYFTKLCEIFFSRKPDQPFIYSVGVFKNRLQLELSLKMVPIIHRNMEKINLDNKANFKKRTSLFKDISKKDSIFENLLRDAIEFFFPTYYLEHFYHLEKKGFKLFKHKSNLIISSHQEISNDIFKVWLSNKVNKGTDFYPVQHGGGYGTMEVSSSEVVLRNTGKKFITWGWKKTPKDLPMPILGNSRTFYSKIKNNSILVVGNTHPRYNPKISSEPVSSNNIKYINNQIELLKMLDSNIIENTFYRPYLKDFWDETTRINRSIKKLNIISNKKAFKKQITDFSLIIILSNSTTFLESFSLNVPTVLFWHSNLFKFSDDFKKITVNLKKHSILHTNSKSLANFINQNFGNFESWWNKSQNQKLRNQVLKNYYYINDDWKSLWNKKIREISQI